MVNKINQAILEIKKNKISNETKELVNNLFFSFDDKIPNNIDIVVILGSDSDFRAKTGASVYEKIKKPIICSGGSVTKGKLSEALRYKRILLKENVLEKDIILEDKSTNSYENILFSFKTIEDIIKKDDINIMIISSSFHLLRVKSIADRVLKENDYSYKIKYYPSFGNKMHPDKWFKYKETRTDIALELSKLIEYNIIEVGK